MRYVGLTVALLGLCCFGCSDTATDSTSKSVTKTSSKTKTPAQSKAPSKRTQSGQGNPTNTELVGLWRLDTGSVMAAFEKSDAEFQELSSIEKGLAREMMSVMIKGQIDVTKEKMAFDMTLLAAPIQEEFTYTVTSKNGGKYTVETTDSRGHKDLQELVVKDKELHIAMETGGPVLIFKRK